MDGSIKVEETASAGIPRRAIRNIALLAICQALTQSCNTLMFASSALAVLTIVAPDMRMFANLPVTMQHLGVMLSVFPAAAIMMRRGRGFGFRVGSVFGMTGAGLCGLGLHASNFLLMCVGGLLLGYAVAALQMYRFAAVELVPPSYRARAISWVTAGGVLAGTIGPAVVRTTYDTLMPHYLGTYVSMMAIHVVVFIVMGFIRFPVVHAVAANGSEEKQRPLWEIARQPRGPRGLFDDLLELVLAVEREHPDAKAEVGAMNRGPRLDGMHEV